MRVIKILISGLVILQVLQACTGPDKQQMAQKPNVIFIMADDLGYNDLGCYGSKEIKTPNIDRMAREGMRFTNHYAGTSVCAPSRCALMTGLTTGHCQVRGNRQWEPYGQMPLAEGTATVSSKFKEAGYKTALIGKWGLGVEGTSGDPLRHGFDYAYGYLCQVLAHNHSPEYLMENGEKVYLGNKVVYTDTSHWTRGLGSYPIEIQQFSQELFTKKTIEFIESSRNDPFFIYLSVVIPHDNGEAPEGKRYSDIPSFSPYEKEDWTESEMGYAAMITYLDRGVGEILEKLSELGLTEKTLVIFTSDNGGDSPGRFRELSNAPFRGIKRDLYEGGIRVPMIARWPGRVEPGVESDHPSAFWDFMPTVCELAGIDTPSETDGISYLPELLGDKQRRHESLYFEFHEQGGKQAIIKGDWKCIRLNTRIPGETVVELYNLRQDVGETSNLAGQYPETVAEMLSLMDQSRTENDHFKLFPDVGVK